MKKRNKQFLKEKEFLRLQNALAENHRVQRELGYVELSVPIFIGWTAKLSLRDDIKNRSDAWVFEFLIEHLSTTAFTRKKEYFFWFNKKNVVNNWRTVHDKPHIRGINENYYINNLSPQVKKWFVEIETQHNYWGKWYNCTVPDFYWEIIYEKTYRTHVKLFDEVLQQEEAELKDEISRKFHHESKYFGSVPKSYRKLLNRAQRNKSKETLYNIVYKDSENEFEDDYKGAAWDYW
jgi:hypothetical protein